MFIHLSLVLYISPWVDNFIGILRLFSNIWIRVFFNVKI